MADGSTKHLTSTEIVELAKYGYQQLEDGSKEPTKEQAKVVDVDEMTTDERLVAAEKRLQEFENKSKQQDEQVKMGNALQRARISNESTKDNDILHKQVSLVTLTKVNLNPRLDYETAYKETLAETLEMNEQLNNHSKTKKNATDLVNNSMIGTQRGGEGGSLVDTSKTYTAEDLKKGASRSALQDFLERSRT